MIVDNFVLVIDFINSDVVKYLKNYIKKIFNVEIKFMLYSYSYVDYVMGGNELIDNNIKVVVY